MIPEGLKNFPFVLVRVGEHMAYAHGVQRVTCYGMGCDYIDDDEYHLASYGTLPRLPLIGFGNGCKVSVEFTYLTMGDI